MKPLQLKRQIYLLITIAFSAISEKGVSSPSNSIHQKNSEFMYHPALIEELYQNNEVTTTIIDTLTRREITTLIPRRDIEGGAVPIQISRNPNFAMQEIYRIAEEEIAEKNITSDKEKNRIRAQTSSEKLGTADPEVIEGVALAVADSPASKLMEMFLKLDDFKKYANHIFMESIQLKESELLKRHIVVSDNVKDKIKFQYSKIKISGSEFSQTLRYEMSAETKEMGVRAKKGGGLNQSVIPVIIVAWEIDPLFKDDPQYKQEGVLMNNGSFTIQPYIDENGTVDPHRSIILYHIYIKLERSNLAMEILSAIFRDSVARTTLYDLATAMRREASR